jgi:hypothetical protein
LPGFVCDIYGEVHEPIPTRMLAALPPRHRAGCLLLADSKWGNLKLLPSGATWARGSDKEQGAAITS